MDGLGTEVGQKMRSAVKAKLIELGTGGAAGYIDDELPDYVMIMVANKRSKQQMIGDLNLFLGSQTELFVTWLHEVLQKLQEVTLPASVAQKAKRKASAEIEAPAITVAAKREKKEKKKDKKLKRTNSDKNVEENNVPPANISDVVADHLLQKAKKTMEDESTLKIKGSKKESNDKTDEFDIPTITEIAAERTEIRIPNQKELAELAELQKRIEQAKRQLKAIASDESEDEDFLNIKEDADEFDVDVNDKTNRKAKAKSPIVFDANQNSETERDRDQTKSCHAVEFRGNKRMPIRFNYVDNYDRTEPTRPKRSVHERLGLRSPRSKENMVSLSTHRRSEKELYVPVFRRNDAERDRDHERQKERDRESRQRGRSRDIDSEKESFKGHSHFQERDDPKFNIRQRIGSRVIVAPPKPDYDENAEDIERPINSVIKIKPRPPVSPSKQASKNLLLRAVAEAQKSTALVKQPSRESPREHSPNIGSRSQKLYTKSYRNRSREALLKRAAKDNIVIEVNASGIGGNLGRNDRDEDEYVPEPISDRGDSDTDYVYVPRAINSANSDDEYLDMEDELPNHHNKTQFVVTLDDKSREKLVSRHKIRVVDKNANGFEIKRLDSSIGKSHSHSKLPSASSGTKRDELTRGKISSAKASDGCHQGYEKPKEVKKLIIKNDTEDEDSTSPTKESRRQKASISEERSTTPPLPKSTAKPNLKRKRSTVSPIKFDLDEHHMKRRSKSGDRETNDRDNDSDDREKDRDRERHDENQQKISIKKTENKYDNIPQLLSSVSVETPPHLIKSKTKERCKYFPSCGKGDSCEFYHPTISCKAFPNCKFADKCMFLHPKCKFDLTCNRTSCNFQHSAPANQSTAPPLASHVVPVQNYKSIIPTPLPAICKYYPNCTNSLCNFYHPKLCRFGKNCMNKVECNFYHHDIPPSKDKFKWVASLG